VKGYTQREGIDYFRTFAPVTKLSTIRSIIAIATQNKYILKQLDAKSAYLNAELVEDIYVKIPEGIEPRNPRATALKLKKAIYGLEQAAREWFKLLATFLQESGSFVQSKVDKCLFKGAEGKWKGYIAMAVYVDDITVVTEKEEDWEEFVKSFQERFPISTAGDLSWLLGLKVETKSEENKIKLSQSQTILETLEEYRMDTAYPKLTPLQKARLGTKKEKTRKEDEEWRKKTPYRSAIGSLNWLARCTRPDIAFAVQFASRSVEDYGKEEWGDIKRILAYLKGSKDLKLHFQKKENDTEGTELVGYSDSDYAGDANDRKSTTGYIFFLYGCAISWKSIKQKSTALSTTQAEYQAMCEATKEAIYLRSLVEFLIRKPLPPTKIYVDNLAAKALADNNEAGSRLKHIDVRYHFNREAVEKEIVTFTAIGSNKNLADIFTKPLERIKFEDFRKQLGILEDTSIEMRRSTDETKEITSGSTSKRGCVDMMPADPRDNKTKQEA